MANVWDSIVGILKDVFKKCDFKVKMKGDDVYIKIEIFGIKILELKLDLLKDGFDETLDD